MPAAEAVARYFLSLAAKGEEPTPVTHLQLQKLLYYAQGWSLGTEGKPLFPERLEASAHGPVVADLFAKFTDYESGPISASEALDDAALSKADRALIEWVWEGYGQYTGWRLREMTHAEKPWVEARGGLPEGAASREPLRTETMTEFFRHRYRANCRRIGLDPDRLDAALKDVREGRTIPWEDVVAEFRDGLAH